MLVVKSNQSGSSRDNRFAYESGFTLLQIMVACAVIGILSAIAVPGYQEYIDRSRNAQAVGMLGEIELEIRAFVIENNGDPPDALAEVGFDGAEDPWGNEIQYVSIAGGGGGRTDHTGAEVNTDYDLYSSGSDGSSATALTADESQDDIIRGNNGGYVGLVNEYPRLP